MWTTTWPLFLGYFCQPLHLTRILTEFSQKKSKMIYVDKLKNHFYWFSLSMTKVKIISISDIILAKIISIGEVCHFSGQCNALPTLFEILKADRLQNLSHDGRIGKNLVAANHSQQHEWCWYLDESFLNLLCVVVLLDSCGSSFEVLNRTAASTCRWLVITSAFQ